MQTQQKESASDVLELMSKLKYFTKLKSEKDSNLFNVPIKVDSYSELNLIVSSLLKASIGMLKNDAAKVSNSLSETGINAMVLLEIALQLLPEEEMELLDELHFLNLK